MILDTAIGMPRLSFRKRPKMAYKRKARVKNFHTGFKFLLLKNPRQRPTLPPTCAGSTIGGSRLNFRVRNGNGCDPAPMATGKLGVWDSTYAASQLRRTGLLMRPVLRSAAGA